MTAQAIFKKTSIAVRWDVSVRTVDRRRDEGLLPPPELYLGREPAWTLETVLAAEEKLKRLPPPDLEGTAAGLMRAVAAASTKKARAKASATKRSKVNARKGLKPASKATRPT